MVSFSLIPKQSYTINKKRTLLLNIEHRVFSHVMSPLVQIHEYNYKYLSKSKNTRSRISNNKKGILF